MTQSCPTLCNPMDCSRPGSSIHGIFQARILEWVAVAFSKVSSQPRDWTPVSCIAGRLFFIIWATEESICQNPYINIMLPLRISFTYFILLHIHHHTKNRGWTLSCLENISGCQTSPKLFLFVPLWFLLQNCSASFARSPSTRSKDFDAAITKIACSKIGWATFRNK